MRRLVVPFVVALVSGGCDDCPKTLTCSADKKLLYACGAASACPNTCVEYAGESFCADAETPEPLCTHKDQLVCDGARRILCGPGNYPVANYGSCGEGRFCHVAADQSLFCAAGPTPSPLCADGVVSGCQDGQYFRCKEGYLQFVTACADGGVCIPYENENGAFALCALSGVPDPRCTATPFAAFCDGASGELVTCKDGYVVTRATCDDVPCEVGRRGPSCVNTVKSVVGVAEPYVDN